MWKHRLSVGLCSGHLLESSSKLLKIWCRSCLEKSYRPSVSSIEACTVTLVPRFLAQIDFNLSFECSLIESREIRYRNNHIMPLNFPEFHENRCCEIRTFFKGLI